MARRVEPDFSVKGDAEYRVHQALNKMWSCCMQRFRRQGYPDAIPAQEADPPDLRPWMGVLVLDPFKCSDQPYEHIRLLRQHHNIHLSTGSDVRSSHVFSSNVRDCKDDVNGQSRATAAGTARLVFVAEDLYGKGRPLKIYYGTRYG